MNGNYMKNHTNIQSGQTNYLKQSLSKISYCMAGLLIIVGTFLCYSEANAETFPRILQCTNHSGNVIFRICGVRGCPATVTYGSTVTQYNMKRVRNPDLSLTYSPRAGSTAKCTIIISPLRYGVRRISSTTCAAKLRKAVCTFSDAGEVTSTPTTTVTPTVTS